MKEKAAHGGGFSPVVPTTLHLPAVTAVQVTGTGVYDVVEAHAVYSDKGKGDVVEQDF